MSAHDQVANKEYPLQSVADDGDELLEEQTLRTVYIEKKSDPLVGSTSFQFPSLDNVYSDPSQLTNMINASSMSVRELQ